MRREFLLKAGYQTLQVSAGACLAPALISKLWPASAEAATGITAQSLHDLAQVTGTGATILVQGQDADWAAHTASHNRVYESIQPRVIALCKSTDGVLKTVQWAVKNGVEIRVRSGGHCFEDFSIGKQLLIDTSLMNGITWDPDANQARIQPGARLGDVYARLFENGRLLPAGSCFGVGISGLTLGGGHGYFSRKYGLTCDHLEEVEMVVVDQKDAAGVPKARVVRANSTTNSDLFWACRGGGGGSFGIATKFFFKTRDIATVTRFYLVWPASDTKVVLKKWQTFAPQADDRLATVAVISAENGQLAEFAISGLFLGSAAELAPIMQELTDTGSLETAPESRFIESDLLTALGRYNGPDPLAKRYFKSSSDYAREELSEEGIDALLDAAQSIEYGTGRVQLEAYGGAIAQIDERATAFSHRKDLFVAQYSTGDWETSEEAAMKTAWVANLRTVMKPYLTGGSYVNYPDYGVTDYEIAYFGVNAQALRVVKKHWDPGNLFRHGQSVKLP